MPLPEDEQSIRTISILTKQMHYNWEVGVHNVFVNYYNKKEIDLAREILEEALARDPESSMLKQDLSRIDR